MKSISKIIVGAAVAGACGYVSAATIVPAAVGNLSLESIRVQPAASTINLGTSVLTLGQGYVLNDSIELSIAGASFATAADHATQSFVCANGAATTSFTLVSASSSSSLLTYTAGTPVGVTAGQTCTIPNINVLAGSITSATDISLSSVSKKAANFVSFDSANSVTAASVGSNFSVSVSTVLDGVIDVQNNRLTFASGTGPSDILNGATGFTAPAGDEDTFQFSINTLGRANVNGVTPSGTMTLTLTGSVGFGFLSDPGTDTAGTCSTGGAGAVAATAVVGGNAVAPSVSVVNSCAGIQVVVPTVAAGQYTVALGRGATSYTTTNATAFTEQTYSTSISLAMTGTGGATRTASVSASPSAGAWSINGTTVNIPYLPISSNIDLIVNIANRSTQTGAVTFTAWNASGTSCTGSLGSIAANANMSVGADLKTELLRCTGTGWAGATRATVQLVIPTPRTTTAVNSSFSVSDGKSRSIVVNDTNGYRN